MPTNGAFRFTSLEKLSAVLAIRTAQVLLSSYLLPRSWGRLIGRLATGRAALTIEQIYPLLVILAAITCQPPGLAAANLASCMT